MNLFQRIRSIVIGLIMIAVGILIIALPDQGYLIAILVLSGTLIFYGIRNLIFYFNMARHMVGGRKILYLAIITIDIGVFSLSLANVSMFIIVIYLFGSHMLSGGIDIMRALENKKYQAPHWKFRLTYGIINIAVGFVCIIFINNINIAVFIYSAGLIFSAISRIISAFRTTSVVYVQ